MTVFVLGFVLGIGGILADLCWGERRRVTAVLGNVELTMERVIKGCGEWGEDVLGDAFSNMELEL